MSIGLKSFSATCEVWVKPLYKKARPKNMETSWVAESYEEMLGLLKVFYAGKRWKLLDWKELTISNSRVLGRLPIPSGLFREMDYRK